MKIAFLLLCCFCICCSVAFGQTHRLCKTYQYEGTDSANAKLVSEQFFNKRGQMVRYYYKGYKEDVDDNFVNKTYFNYYKDTLLKRSISIDDNGVRNETIYFYNKKGQLTGDRYLIYDRSSKRKRRWRIYHEHSYQYDTAGNKISSIVKFEHYKTSHKEHAWSYDKQNRVLEHSLYQDERVWSKERYEYSEGGYKMTRTWYDSEGKPKHEKSENDILYDIQFIFIYRTSKSGQILSEEVKDHKGNFHHRTTMQYDSNGNMIRRSFFDAKGNLVLTHIFKYE